MSTHFLPLSAAVPEACRGGAVTIGNFDGVHLGHQALVEETVRQARGLSAPAVAVTFDPHPQRLLRPDEFQPILTTLEYRARLLHDHGIDQVLVFQIEPAFLRLTARAFFDQVLLHNLRARAVVEGFNFGFGHRREGTTDKLQEWGSAAGLRVLLVPARALDGQPVSTSRVRDELLAGNVAQARRLLGRPYRLQGIVGTGQRRGHTLGFPTANLADVPTLIPGNGVYAARVHVEGRSYAAAVNVGPNPTFGEQARKVEAHLLDFRGDLYGKMLALDFLEKVRDVRTFSGPAELIAQLKTDIAQVRAGVAEW